MYEFEFVEHYFESFDRGLVGVVSLVLCEGCADVVDRPTLLDDSSGTLNVPDILKVLRA